jgi:hypothetical protein
MNKSIIIISTLLLVLCIFQSAFAQNNRTTETKIADILAQMPTEDLDHSNKLMEEIIGLKTDGITQLCRMLIPAGTGDDTQVRYAVESVAIYAGGMQDKIKENAVERAILKTIESVSDVEVKTFLIDRLIYCGSNVSVAQLSRYLSSPSLFNPALASLTAIGTPKAGNSLMVAARNANTKEKAALVAALGQLRHTPSVNFLHELARDKSPAIQREVLMALAEIAVQGSGGILQDAVKKARFKLDESQAILAYIHYGKRLAENGKMDLSANVGNELFKNCTSDKQLHFRTAAIQMLRASKGLAFTDSLIKEAQHKNDSYRGSVLATASEGMISEEVSKWIIAYQGAAAEAKPQLLNMLATRQEVEVFDKCILPAVKGSNPETKIAGIKALVYQDKKKAMPVLMDALVRANTPEAYAAIKGSILRICDAKTNDTLIRQLNKMNNGAKVVLVEVLSARGASAQFNAITSLINTDNEALQSAVFAALPSISTADHLTKLLELLHMAQNDQNRSNAQQAIINILDNAEEDHSKVFFETYNNSPAKERMLPILPSINNEESLNLLTTMVASGNETEQLLALDGLAKWKNNDALPYLFQKASTTKEGNLRSKAFGYYLSQVANSSYPDDQKLLLVKKLMPFSKNLEEQKQILNRAGRIKTFLSMIFVSDYLDNKALAETASRAAIKIALPDPGQQIKYSGDVVRNIITTSMGNLSGPGSEYDRIDVQAFLDNLPNGKGFVSIFNGKDLSGWQGLVENPIARAKMTKEELATKQAIADEQMQKEWVVDNGALLFVGEGYKNLCSVKKYADFEMFVDWKIGNKGDSGIYLRGTPQVQIWDTSRVEVGAQVGSGGLYNNQTNQSSPLKVADNPINDWNTFQIKMVDERVTVHLNGELVVDNVTLENYWDRNLPIFTKDAIELQAHGENVRFKNVYVREIISGEDLLKPEEKADGFKSLFNGRDLDQWVGNKTDYLVENGEISVRPKQGGHGNLYTSEEYSNFIFRFEFKLTPGANNGLGIHAPLEGDAAFVGKELQILEHTASIYANIKPWQCHGSVYGIIAAKRGFLNPVGEWNYEEVIVKGDDIKITLNGTVIVNGNMKEAAKNGTLDGQDHPGLKRNKGHIGFLGHGSELQFRNIRIKELK